METNIKCNVCTHTVAKSNTYLLCEKNLLPSHSMTNNTRIRPNTKAILPAIIVIGKFSLSPSISSLLVGVPADDF